MIRFQSGVPTFPFITKFQHVIFLLTIYILKWVMIWSLREAILPLRVLLWTHCRLILPVNRICGCYHISMHPIIQSMNKDKYILFIVALPPWALSYHVYCSCISIRNIVYLYLCLLWTKLTTTSRYSLYLIMW